MIALPKWVSLGITGVYAAYTVLRAVAGIATGAMPWAQASALVVFVGAFVACSYLPASRWSTVLVPTIGVGASIALPVMIAPGLDPDGSYASGAWQVDAIACLAIVLLMRGRLVFASVACLALVVHVVVWAGPLGLLRYAVLALLLVFAVVAAASAALRSTEAELLRYAAAEQETVAWQIAQSAYQTERRARLLQTGATARQMLQRIATADGGLEEHERAECRVLEQTIRDEIRGRRLLNDAVREQVLAHRRRGAFVQVHDDGGLDDVAEEIAGPMLDRIARAIAPLTSNRIVIRTAPKDSASAVTVVASSVDPIAAALGLDDDETVDLWLDIERPAVAVAG